MVIHRKIKVDGQVQGVGFRFFTRSQARKLSLRGWVRNEPDGGVAIEIEGDRQKIKALLSWLQTGPPLSKVKKIKVSKGKLVGYQNFVIEKRS